MQEVTGSRPVSSTIKFIHLNTITLFHNFGRLGLCTILCTNKSILYMYLFDEYCQTSTHIIRAISNGCSSANEDLRADHLEFSP